MAAESDIQLLVQLKADFSKLEAQIRNYEKRLGQNLKFAPDTKGISNLTSKVGEFDAAINLANKRIISFGASAAVIGGVALALKSAVTNAIDIQKSLTDINILLNLSSTGLAKFGDKLFDVAKNTGSAFKQVAAAATELSRQGLSAEETLKRTNDALILTRLSGLEASKAVET